MEDPYAIAICAYALSLAQHPSARTVFNLMEAKAESSGKILLILQSNPFYQAMQYCKINNKQYFLFKAYKNNTVDVNADIYHSYGEGKFHSSFVYCDL